MNYIICEFGLNAIRGHQRSIQGHQSHWGLNIKNNIQECIFCMYATMTGIINKYYLNLTSASIEGH